MRGQTFAITVHATGWSGFAATRFAGPLQNKYYLLFCLFLVIVWLHHDWYVALRRYNPPAVGYMNIRALLREYRKTPSATLQERKTDESPQTGLV
jgi:hypothetical protein